MESAHHITSHVTQSESRTTQRNTTTQHNTTQHNTTQHNTTDQRKACLELFGERRGGEIEARAVIDVIEKHSAVGGGRHHLLIEWSRVELSYKPINTHHILSEQSTAPYPNWTQRPYPSAQFRCADCGTLKASVTSHHITSHHIKAAHHVT
jgi:hypothetical protein